MQRRLDWVAEVLSCNIRASNKIDRIKLPGGHVFKMNQYADDATCIVLSIRSLHNLLSLTERYGKGTGAKLNLSKTEVMWLGAWLGNPNKPFDLKWVTKMRVLGVYFGSNTDGDNWDARIKYFRRLTDSWLQRDLSVKGRLIIATTLGLSKFFFVSKGLIPPNRIFKELDKILINFLWHGKAHLVNRDVCTMPFLPLAGFISLIWAFHLAYLTAFFDDTDLDWKYILRYFIGRQLDHIFPCTFLHGNSYPNTLCVHLVPFFIDTCSILLDNMRFLSPLLPFLVYL